MSKYLIVNADDCGMQLAFNNAVLQAHTEGVLTSASLCATGPALEDAVQRVVPQCPRLGIGIHLCLTVGQGLTAGKATGGLLRADGSFRPCMHGFLWLRAHVWPSPALRAGVKAELRAQIETLLSRVKLDHADSHHHVHMIPWIMDIAAELCTEYKIPFIRFTDEPLAKTVWRAGGPGLLLAAHCANMRLMARTDRVSLRRFPALRHNGSFCGLCRSGSMNAEVIRQFLAMPPKAEDSINEVLLHPALLDANAEKAPFMSAEMEATIRSPERARELAVLLDAELGADIAAAGFSLCNYRDLSGMQ